MPDRIEHPMRAAEIAVFKKVRGNAGPAYIARLYGGNAEHMVFHGATEDEAEARAETFRTDAVERHEATYIARRENVARARAARKEKAAGDE